MTRGLEITQRTVATLHRIVSDQFVRRLALLLEVIDRAVIRRSGHPLPLPSGPSSSEECVLLAVVAHWRGTVRPGVDPTAESLLLALEGLMTMPVRQLEIVVVTNDDDAAYTLLRDHLGHDSSIDIVRGAWARPSGAAVALRIERWHPRWPRNHGFFLTRHHQEVFRRALRGRHFTHLLYLEDDLLLARENLDYWLAARQALAASGDVPGFVRFERLGDRMVLVDQTRTGQHEDLRPSVTIDGLGEVSLRRSRRPHQACYLADRELAAHHLEASPFRTPLRSNVARCGLRERAAAGPTIGPTPRLFRALLRPREARPSVRSVVATTSTGGAHMPVAGALIEHLRPVYSRDASSRHGKIAVEDF